MMKPSRKNSYISPSILQTSDVLLESDLLGGSIRDSFEVLISGQETGGYYEGTDIDNVWMD